jgi:hypothetical protein
LVFVVDVLSLPERRNYCASAYHAEIDRLFVPRTDNGMLSAMFGAADSELSGVPAGGYPTSGRMGMFIYDGEADAT